MKALQRQGMLQRCDAPGFLGRGIAGAIVRNRAGMAEDHEAGGKSGDLRRKARTREGRVQPRNQPVIQPVHPVDRRLVQQVQRDLASGHGNGIGGEGPAPGQARLAVAMVIDPHDLAPPGDRADGIAAADDLGQRGQIGLDAQKRLRAADMGAEGDHLVQDQQRADLAGQALDHVDEGARQRDKAQIAGRRIQQHAGNRVGIGADDALGRLDIVEGDDDDIIGHALRHAPGIADRIRVIAPVRGRGIKADFGIVIRAVIDALGLDDLGAAGDRAGGLDRAHHRFRAGIAEPDLFEAFGAGADGFGQRDLGLSGQGEGRAIADLRAHRLDDLGMGMAMDQRGEVVQQIKAPHIVDIDDIGPFAARRIDRKGFLPGQGAGDAAGQHFQAAIIKRLGSRSLVRPVCHNDNPDLSSDWAAIGAAFRLLHAPETSPCRCRA